MEPDFGSWQTPDISRFHLYRGTIAWTQPTAIYRAYTVTQNETQTTINYKQKNLRLYLIDQYNPLDV